MSAASSGENSPSIPFFINYLTDKDTPPAIGELTQLVNILENNNFIQEATRTPNGVHFKGFQFWQTAAHNFQVAKFRNNGNILNEVVVSLKMVPCFESIHGGFKAGDWWLGLLSTDTPKGRGKIPPKYFPVDKFVVSNEVIRRMVQELKDSKGRTEIKTEVEGTGSLSPLTSVGEPSFLSEPEEPATANTGLLAEDAGTSTSNISLMTEKDACFDSVQSEEVHASDGTVRSSQSPSPMLEVSPKLILSPSLSRKKEGTSRLKEKKALVRETLCQSLLNNRTREKKQAITVKKFGMQGIESVEDEEEILVPATQDDNQVSGSFDKDDEPIFLSEFASYSLNRDQIELRAIEVRAGKRRSILSSQEPSEVSRSQPDLIPKVIITKVQDIILKAYNKKVDTEEASKIAIGWNWKRIPWNLRDPEAGAKMEHYANKVKEMLAFEEKQMDQVNKEYEKERLFVENLEKERQEAVKAKERALRKVQAAREAETRWLGDIEELKKKQKEEEEKEKAAAAEATRIRNAAKWEEARGSAIAKEIERKAEENYLKEWEREQADKGKYDEVFAEELSSAIEVSIHMGRQGNQQINVSRGEGPSSIKMGKKIATHEDMDIDEGNNIQNIVETVVESMNKSKEGWENDIIALAGTLIEGLVKNIVTVRADMLPDSLLLLIKKSNIYQDLKKENEDLTKRLDKGRKDKAPVVDFSRIVKDAAVLKTTFTHLSMDKALKTAYELGQEGKNSTDRGSNGKPSHVNNAGGPVRTPHTPKPKAPTYANAAKKNVEDKSSSKMQNRFKPNTTKAHVDNLDILSGNEDEWEKVQKKKKDFPKPVVGSKKNELTFHVKDEIDILTLKSKSEKSLLILINEAVQKSHTSVADHDNLAINVAWTFQEKFRVIFKESINDQDGIIKALRAEFQMNEDDFILLNHPTTSSIKFLAVPTHKVGGVLLTPNEIEESIKQNLAWEGIVMHGKPTFIKANGYEEVGPTGVVKVSFVDDKNATTAKRLENTTTHINGKFCRARHWWNKDTTPQCTNCCRWGHTTFRCISMVSICAKCAGHHPTIQHGMYCETCITTGEDCSKALCANCNGNHQASSPLCEFYTKQNDLEYISEMYRKCKDA